MKIFVYLLNIETDLDQAREIGNIKIWELFENFSDRVFIWQLLILYLFVPLPVDGRGLPRYFIYFPNFSLTGPEGPGRPAVFSNLEICSWVLWAVRCMQRDEGAEG